MEPAARRRLFFPILVSLGFLCIPLFSQPKLPQQLRGFISTIEQARKEWNVPGLAVAIVKDGEIILADGFGYRNLKEKLPVTASTIFAIGSCSKAFTATAVSLLVDEGKLDWDKPVREYLPTFRLYDPIATEKITTKDLLSHRSGLPRHEFVWYGSSFSRQELFSRLAYLEPSTDIRYLWQYQNLMFMVAGVLIEKITGQSWEEFVRLRIFQPLGMKDANFSVVDSQKAPDFALPYQETEGRVEEIPFRPIEPIGPAGSINAHVLDMAKWVLFNLNKGKVGDKQVVSEARINEIHSPQMVIPGPIRFPEILYSSYGLGWMITPYRGHLLLSHGGSIDGFSAWVAFLPLDRLGLVILTNMQGTPLPQILGYTLIDRLLNLSEIPWSQRFREEAKKAREQAEKRRKERLQGKREGTQPSHPLEEYVGDYEHPGYGVISVLKDNNQLKIRFHDFELKLAHFHYDVFVTENRGLLAEQRLSFQTDLNGRVASLSVQLEPAVKEIVFTRVPDKTQPEKNFLAQFCGEYEIEGAIIKVYLKGETSLAIQSPGQPEVELLPTRGNEFNFKDVVNHQVEFVKDEKGTTVELILKQPNGTFRARRKF